MTLLILAVGFAFFGVAVSAWVVFREYPNSAVDSARNALFVLRGELFELGRSGEVPFDSPAYRLHRSLLNGMIRYAHDISVSQLFFHSILENEAEAARFRAEVQSEIKSSLLSIKKPAREKLNRIMRQASGTLFHLVMVRSVFMSTILAIVVLANALQTILSKARESVARVSRRSQQSQVRSNVESAIEDILEHRPRVRPTIEAEAYRYVGKGCPALRAA